MGFLISSYVHVCLDLNLFVLCKQNDHYQTCDVYVNITALGIIYSWKYTKRKCKQNNKTNDFG